MDGYGPHCADELTNLFKKNNIDILLLPAHASHGFQPLDLSTFHAMMSRVKQMQTSFEKGTQGHQIQRAIMALHAATNLISNITAFRKGGITQDCTKTPAIATINEFRFQQQVEKVQG
ncbi:MAG: hypothetical protein EZS28_044547 [Streblomastix strix]|uniref:DDE-1 domain-containing protein n=1 Tax=Streblomastix strix TaxID=222440 RepID=A0A5J4TN20_9EUKA|nr:MAG: hypothetical protein EZS28_044547 [Streblomastix strix]